MIRPEDLRIGNWALFPIGKNGTPKKVTARTIVEQCQADMARAVYLKPIPLTEEILVKAGFERRDSSTCTQWHIGINEITHDWLFSLTWLERPDLINAPDAPFFLNGRFTIHFVHDLQNLYYALTKQELQIEL
jgi:hypothetical protein